MKQVIYWLILVIGTSISTCTFAESEDDIKFQFAPAPVTNSVNAGEKQRRMSLHYLSYGGAIDLQGYGFTTNERTGHESGKSSNSLVHAFTFLTGSGSSKNSEISSATDMELTGLTYDTANNLEWKIGSNAILSLGIKLDLNYFSVTSTTTTFGNSFEFDSRVLSIYAGGQPGFQYHINITPHITVTPYVLYNYAYVYTTVESGDFTNSSDDQVSNTVIGLDITLFRQYSIASMFQRSKDDNLLFINLGWNF